MVLEGSKAPEFRDVEEWINSDPLSINDTLLLDFWNYSCHICSRRVRSIQELHEEYSGIKVVGVHTPRFSFEEEAGNVRKAVERRGIDYSIAVDDGATWQAYGGYRWPTNLIVDEGEVKWKTAGGAKLSELGKAVSEVLGEDTRGIDSPGSGSNRRREIHLGYRWGGGFNGSGNFRGVREFEAPAGRSLNGVYLEGRWRQEEEYLEALEGAKLFLPSQSSDISVVAGPGGGIRDIRVRKDGEVLGGVEAGEDVKDDGSVRVRYPELYRLVDSPGQGFELALAPESGTRLYSITVTDGRYKNC